MLVLLACRTDDAVMKWCFGSWPGGFRLTASLAFCIAGGKRTPVIETSPWWSWLKAVSDSVDLLVPNRAPRCETNDTRGDAGIRPYSVAAALGPSSNRFADLPLDWIFKGGYFHLFYIR